MEIRRSYYRLISTVGFPILVRCHLYIESGPWCCLFSFFSYSCCVLKGDLNLLVNFFLGICFFSLISFFAWWMALGFSAIVVTEPLFFMEGWFSRFLGYFGRTSWMRVCAVYFLFFILRLLFSSTNIFVFLGLFGKLLGLLCPWFSASFSMFTLVHIRCSKWGWLVQG